MRYLVILSLLVPAPLQAAELWCMPSQICRSAGCKPTQNEETSVRLADLTAKKTTMRSNAEDVAMTRTKKGAATQWKGKNSYGETETLTVRSSDLTFTYINRSTAREWQATGVCEVQ